jgi:hypothetical protein
MAAATLALTELCRDCPAKAAYLIALEYGLQDNNTYKGPFCKDNINQLINSETVAARRLPLLLVEQLLLSRVERVEEWVSYLLEYVSSKSHLDEAGGHFRRDCLPLLTKLLDSTVEEIQVSATRMPHAVQFKYSYACILLRHIRGLNLSHSMLAIFQQYRMFNSF